DASSAAIYLVALAHLDGVPNVRAEGSKKLVTLRSRRDLHRAIAELHTTGSSSHQRRIDDYGRSATGCGIARVTAGRGDAHLVRVSNADRYRIADCLARIGLDHERGYRGVLAQHVPRLRQAIGFVARNAADNALADNRLEGREDDLLVAADAGLG